MKLLIVSSEKSQRCAFYWLSKKAVEDFLKRIEELKILSHEEILAVPEITEKATHLVIFDYLEDSGFPKFRGREVYEKIKGLIGNRPKQLKILKFGLFKSKSVVTLDTLAQDVLCRFLQPS